MAPQRSRAQVHYVVEHGDRGVFLGCTGVDRSNAVEIVAVDADQIGTVECDEELRVSCDGVRQEVLDLYADDLICRGIDS